MSLPYLSIDALRHALNLRDLSNPADGDHAMQLIVADILDGLKTAWDCEVREHRDNPVVSIQQNYDALNYPRDGAAREARYTRYVCDTALLRTHTSAMIPRAIAGVGGDWPDDILLACPGMAYRRDCIDRIHSAEPHQMDLWRLKRNSNLGRADLDDMIGIVMQAAIPGMEWRIEPRRHPYTLDGVQIDALWQGEWIEVGECGVINPEIVARYVPDSAGVSGLAMGPGLDRLLMLRKGVPDIRLLRSNDPRVTAQMRDLSPYRPVSLMPPAARDLSIVVDAASVAEDLGDRIRQVLHGDADVVESVEILSETGYDDLPAAAIARIGMNPGQKNILVRVVLRSLDRTLLNEECNAYRNRIYAALHQGGVSEWAGG